MLFQHSNRCNKVITNYYCFIYQNIMKKTYKDYIKIIVALGLAILFLVSQVRGQSVENKQNITQNATQNTTQSVTRLLIGQWQASGDLPNLSQTPDYAVFLDVIAFTAQGDYHYGYSNIIGKGVWELSKNEQKIKISNFTTKVTSITKHKNFAFDIEKITENELWISRKVKKKVVKMKYKKII